MQAKYIEEGQKRMAAIQLRQDDLSHRMDAYMAEQQDHLDYLKRRAATLNANETPVSHTDFQDINKFLTIMGLKEVQNAEDRLEQNYAVSVSNQYQAFLDETRALRKDRLESLIQIGYGTIEVFSKLIEDMQKDLPITDINTNNKALLAERHRAEEFRRTFITETQADIERIQSKIAVDKLKLAGLQKEVLN